MNRVLLLFLPFLLSAQTAEQVEFFEKKIRPVLANSCQACHNPKVKTAGLDLSTSEGILHGGQSGPILAKEDPEKSALLRVLSYDDRLKMPPTGKLKPEELADFATWVNSGAALPGTVEVKQTRPQTNERAFTEQEKKFWAFQKVADPAPPAVKDALWAKSPLDRFILAKLEEKGLKAASPADKVTLLRRVTFDLTGLPPTEQEVKAFLADQSPQAFEKVVDRLLASPRYGEQWGRHWLDIARYADSTGNDEDHRYPYAWRYRDYVIDAFNRDMPYDQFVREQVAGDLLPSETPGAPNRRGTIATGFLALGPKAIAQQDKKKMLYDVYDEQVDVTSKAIMGLTLACARCHDHKFDPLLTKDYYSMISMFASTKVFDDAELHVSKMLYTPLVSHAEYDQYKKAQQQANRKKFDVDDFGEQQLSVYKSQFMPRLADYMVAARRVYAEKADAAAVAKEAGLREEMLKKWAAYLTPDAARVHLEEWENAAPARRAEVAKSFQARFEKTQGEWDETIAKWRERFRKMSEEMNMPPPPRPRFEADKDRFFFEVSFMQGPLAVRESERAAIMSPEARETYTRLRKEYDALKVAIPPEPDMACAVGEGKVVDQKIFIRGDYNAPGADAPKAFPVILAGFDQPRIPQGSGRLQFAHWLTGRDHPLTARVFANRVWYWHFGEGIVRTPDNFGKMGERPTHPELLDWLARRFMESGWSVKALHKTILLSSAYQMSSRTLEASVQADPENKLFSRFPRRRLGVEEMRDGLLAIDGSIDYEMGGTLQKGFGTDGENSNDRLSIRPETNRRRMVYLPLRRANLPTLLNLFDFGDATTSQSKRPITTIAPQALFMMNSDFISERARNLGKAILDMPDTASRVRSLYLRVLNREANPDEIDASVTYVDSFRKKFAPERTESDAWMSLSRILIASNEFIYLD